MTTTAEATRRLITQQQAADMLGLSPRTIFELAERGELSRIKFGAAVRFDVRDVESLIERRKEGR